MPKIVNTLGVNGEAIFPSSYGIETIRITNHEGRSIDINGLVTDFTITESIYLPSLILDLSVRDSVNLVEELQLSGQEKIRVSVLKKDKFTGEIVAIKHDFYVTEYPIYGKFAANRLQTYKIKAISEHAFLSKFKKISRAFTGNIKEFVKSVLVRDLGYSESLINVSDRACGNVSFIVPNLAPLDAIAWALRRAYDTNGSPWYCYESLYDSVKKSSVINIVPQGEMVKKDPYHTYREIVNLKGKVATEEDYNQRRDRIKAMSSDLKMSKYVGGANGAFGSTVDYIDIHTKKRVRSKFSYGSEYSRMEWSTSDGMNLSTGFTLGGQTLDTYLDAKQFYLPINSKGLGDKPNYHSTTANGQIGRANSYVNNLDNLTHDIKIDGDIDLNAGNTIQIKVSKSIDPTLTVKNSDETQDSQTNPWDDVLSGKYLVASVMHKFGEEHECEVRIKRDNAGSVPWMD